MDKLDRDKDCKSILVKNLPANITGQDLKSHFTDIGDVAFVEVERQDGKCNGIVTFKAPEDAKLAVVLKNGAKFGDCTVQLSLHRTK